MVYPYLELGLAGAKAMPFFDLCDGVWRAVEKAGGTSNFGLDIESYVYHLPTPWRIAYAVHDMQYSVLGGGFTSYFDTHAQTLHQDALNGFKLIGAEKHHAIVQQALKLQQDEEALQELDSLYYDCCAEADPRELLASYILEHFPAYREPKQSRLALGWRALKLRFLRLTKQL